MLKQHEYYVGLRTIDHRTQTCCGERGNDLFPIVNVICGIVSMLLQSINVCPTGLGSFSHSFYRKNKELVSAKLEKLELFECSIQK